MRAIVAMLMVWFAFPAASWAATWFYPAAPGLAPAVVQIGVDDAAALRLSDALRARGFASGHVSMTDAGEDLSGFLAEGRALDRSRMSLIASADHAADAIALLGNAETSSLAWQGLVLRIDTDLPWSDLPTPARWPSLLLVYDAARRAAREAAFGLAATARAAGAAVWLQPQSASAADEEAAIVSWLAALEVRRTRRFEDAVVAPYRGPRHEALVADLSKRVPRDLHDPVLARVPDREGGRSIELRLDDGGRLLQVGPDGARAEFDARAALAAVYGDPELRMQIGPAAVVPLAHPETGARVHALPTALSTRAGGRSLLMLRHADGSYAYLDLADRRVIQALMASAEARDRGRVWWALMDAADATGSRVLRIALAATTPRRGLWWDPSHPGHALDLQPVAGGHSAIWATFDGDGQSRWYLASGRITRDRFVASQDGLQLMRRDPALSAPKSDPRHGGRISIEFGIDARHPACLQRKAQATQLALLQVVEGGRSRAWCIEPVALPAGVPDADVNGTWYGGANDSGWGLSVVASGEGESQLMSAMLYFHDAEGWPRWAMGAARAGIAGTALVMNEYAQDCVGCRSPKLVAHGLGDLTLRTQGWCAQPDLRAAFALGADRSRPFRRDEMALTRLTEARCH